MRHTPQVILIAFGLGYAVDARGETELLKTRTGSPAHWLRSRITIGIDTAATSRNLLPVDVEEAIERATRVWNDVHAGQPLLVMVSGGRPDVTLRFCQDRWHGDDVDLGQTQFTASLHDGTVTAATIELNECGHRFWPSGKASSAGFSLRAVLAHEFGHALGLGHSRNPDSIMHPSGAGARPTRLHREDETALATLYLGRALEPGPSIAAAYRPLLEPGNPSEFPEPADRHQTDHPSQAGLEQASIASSQEWPVQWAPINSVSVMNIKTNEGREVLIYTCEPTVLPPVTAAPTANQARRPTPSHHRSRAR